MKSFKSKVIGGLLAALVAGSASANIVNDNRPHALSATGGDGPGSSLQDVFNNNITGGSISAANDQSNAAVWYGAEADVDIYTITMLAGASTGSLYVYSYGDPAKMYEVLNKTSGATFGGFGITSTGTLLANGGATSIAGFGSLFGYMWDSWGNQSYTEDSLNSSGYGPDSNIRALTYEVADGLTVQTASGISATAKGNDDWILAFEDGTDNDFQDAVFYVEDMLVPVPATLALMGLGLIGMGFAKRRRQA